MARADILASIYGFILAWPDNKNAPGDAANEHRRHIGKESNSSFRSLHEIIHDAAGEELLNETE